MTLDNILVWANQFWSWLSFNVLLIILICGVTTYVCRLILHNPREPEVVTWSDKVHSGYGNLLFAMLSILWASTVSVLGTDLKNQWIESTPVGWESIFFAFSVCLAIVVGFLHYIGQQKKELEQESKPPILSVQCASSHVIVLSNELHSCQLDWAQILRNAGTIRKRELDAFESNLYAAKKACLKAMLDVVQNWSDSNDENVTYKSNLFNLASASDVLHTFEQNQSAEHNGTYSFTIDAINKSPFFLFNDNWRAKLERCDYIMVNEQSLSVSIPLCRNEPRHHPICMPYSEEIPQSPVTKQPNLHGAPIARKKKRVVYLPEVLKNVEDKIKSLETSPTYKHFVNERFKQDLVKYYEFDTAGSIISIPIHKYKMGAPFTDGGSLDNPVKDSEKITCILNIYANKNYILENNNMADAYYDLTKPICYMLSVLVSLRTMLVEFQSAVPLKLDYTLCDQHVEMYLKERTNGQ
ncbi:hypothetical protein JFQ74_004753 [Vibrio parahaemolyticus]|uniref:hypothetical protein n=2 Tax=Vibrio harveyi group TaxID=717610 RepID=UPI0021D20506|nr:hypothetical protein [Vibrio parahaemolyticus]